MPRTKEKCKELKEEMKNTILKKSMIYFVRNGFAGTKISDLSKHIGIAAGTIYIYFESKEDLYSQIISKADTSQEIKKLRILNKTPLPARLKLNKISDNVLKRIEDDEMYAAMVALNAQLMLENKENTYQSELYRITSEIIEKGQKEGSVVRGYSLKLADYYWGVIYLYALKKIFTEKYEMITTDDLLRTIVLEKNK